MLTYCIASGLTISERRTVLAQYNENHVGDSKTVTKIRQSYYWPGLQADVRVYIAGCDKCRRKKGFQRSKRSPVQLVQTGDPAHRHRYS